ncbi:MAG: segregation/condensation protein A [Acidobacteriota bacterium]
MSSPLNFHLEQYDGPLDLLLDLIRKQEINIYDIPIARITQQYLEYMTHAADKNIELSAEFVYMAASLIHIKSKLLLPRDPELAKLETEEEDPRAELVERLLEHERFKSAAEMLHQKRIVEEAVWSNPQIAEFRASDEDPGLAVTLFDLVKTLQGVLDRVKARPIYEVSGDDVSVPDMIRFLRAILENSRGPVPAVELFERQKSRRAMICLFLAMLELVKAQAVGLTQSESFGEIALKRLKGFDTAFSAGGDVMSTIEQGYN